MPTTSPTIAVRGSNVSGPVGSVLPKPLSSASSPTAAATPRPTPIADETNPTITASVSTERIIWPRLAPTTRSRASSLVRWPTMIEERCGRIVNAPTKSEISAKISSAVLRNDNAWAHRVGVLLDNRLPGDDSASDGRARAIARCTAALSAPGLAHSSMKSNLPRFAEHALRGRQRERRQGSCPGQVVGRPELRDAGDGERLHGLQAGGQDLHPLADA